MGIVGWYFTICGGLVLLFFVMASITGYVLRRERRDQGFADKMARFRSKFDWMTLTKTQKTILAIIVAILILFFISQGPDSGYYDDF